MENSSHDQLKVSDGDKLMSFSGSSFGLKIETVFSIQYSVSFINTRVNSTNFEILTARLKTASFPCVTRGPASIG